MGIFTSFDRDIFECVAAGRSAIDIPKLNIKTRDSARAFVQAYGYNLDHTGDVEKLLYYYRRSLVLLTEKLDFKIEDIHPDLREPRSFSDLGELLIWASQVEDREKQRWACALLRCMHVFIHSENDLFASFSEEIQSQILSPFQSSIQHHGDRTVLQGQLFPELTVELKSFHIKPFKTSSSTVIKLLAKPDALAMKVFDKLGVRFVTESIFDSFRVIKFLLNESIISFPHIMPDQSSNNLFPVEIFFDYCAATNFDFSKASPAETDRKLKEMLADPHYKNLMFRKSNDQSAQNFKFIKFITRKLVTIRDDKSRAFSFFYPYEVQILDQEAHSASATGPSEHESYKERQRQAARHRVLRP
ncbi:MAG: TIGR04552 family protein [Bdellovibrionota bacterium]